MDITRRSGLTEYCIGIVVETKLRDSDKIKVWPSEELSMYKGKLKETKHTDTYSFQDSQGNTKTSTVDYSAAIEASWVMGESNRVTSPDVVHGESVVIYRYADTDEYYWRPLYSSEASLRRKEHVINAYSNVPDGVGKKKFDPDSSYWTLFSTFKQLVHLHTSDNDGEKVKYDIKLNPKDGIFTWEDGIGNKVEINSTEAVIRFTNKEGVVYEITSDNINETYNDTKTVTGDKMAFNVREIKSTSANFNMQAENVLIESETTRITSQLIDNPQINDHEVRIRRLEGFH